MKSATLNFRQNYCKFFFPTFALLFFFTSYLFAFDLDKVPADRKKIVQALLYWHDADKISDSKVAEIKKKINFLDFKMSSEMPYFVNPCELKFLETGEGKSAVDSEGWVKAQFGALLVKFNILETPILLFPVIAGSSRNMAICG